MLEDLTTFAGVTIGMLLSVGVGWRLGRIMSPRPRELRELARDLEQGRQR
ncbi:hypothetical protein [Bosea sp. Tri-44]|nr:hypothetical protein [Bosea sp. Tri-44]